VHATTLPDLNTPIRDVPRGAVVPFLETETVSQALERLPRESAGDRIINFYVVDSQGKLAGVVPTRRLLLSGPAARIGEIMVKPVVSVSESQPFRSALEVFRSRKLLALPVVDDSGEESKQPVGLSKPYAVAVLQPGQRGGGGVHFPAFRRFVARGGDAGFLCASGAGAGRECRHAIGDDRAEPDSGGAPAARSQRGKS
jgi:CBS domain-containing protein